MNFSRVLIFNLQAHFYSFIILSRLRLGLIFLVLAHGTLRLQWCYPLDKSLSSMHHWSDLLDTIRGCGSFLDVSLDILRR